MSDISPAFDGLIPPTAARNSVQHMLSVNDSMLSVADVMNEGVLAIDPNSRASDAFRFLDGLRIDVAPVVPAPWSHFATAADLAGAGKAATVGNVARPISPSELVSIDLPLGSLLQLMRRQAWLFCFGAHGVCGIVTRSDLHSLPVSMHAYGYVLALEAGLDALITTHYGDSWPGKLSPAVRERVEGIYQERIRDSSDISLQACLSLDHRVTLVAKSTKALGTLGMSRREFEGELRSVKRLRNTLAHGGSIMDAGSDAADAINRVLRVRELAELAASWAEPVPAGV